MKGTIRALLVACTCLLAFPVGAQTRADVGLVSEISKIKAIDNHAHPLKYVAPGEKPEGRCAQKTVTFQIETNGGGERQARNVVFEQEVAARRARLRRGGIRG